MKKAVLATAVLAFGSSQAFSAGVSAETSPFTLAVGLVNGTVLFDLNETIAVGPKLSYWGFEVDGDGFSLFSAGLRADIAPNGLKQSGVYFGATVDYRSLSVDTTITAEDFGTATSVDCEGDFSLYSTTGLLGYAFRANTGIFARIGAGVSLGNSVDLDIQCSDGTNDSVALPLFGAVSPALEFNLGYKF